MNAFQEEVSKQEHAFEELKRVVKNFSKEAKTKRKHARLLQQTDQINKIWDEFKLRNTKLAEDEANLIQTKYFKDRHFEIADVKVQKMKEKLKSLLDEMNVKPMEKATEVGGTTERSDNLASLNNNEEINSNHDSNADKSVSGYNSTQI